MSRSGYIEDYDNSHDEYPDLTAGRWRAQVLSAIRGKRGQAFFREMVEALDAMPEKRLISHELRKDGEVCAIGCVGAKRGVDLEALDPEDPETIAGKFGIAHQMVREIEFENDERGPRDETPEQRWVRIRKWAACQIKVTP